MNSLTKYILEKLVINKDVKSEFFNLSEDELKKRICYLIKKHYKHDPKGLYFDKINNEWRLQVLINVAFTDESLPHLYYKIVTEYGDEKEYNEVVKQWKYDNEKDEWYPR